VPVLLVGIASLYSIRTVVRNRDWRTDEILCARTLELQPDASLIRTNLGTIPFGQGDYARAEKEWLRALADGPNNVFVLNDLGLLRERQHRYDEALDYYWRALRLRPVYTMAHTNLADALAELGRTSEAEWQYRVATTLTPLSSRAHNSYGKFLFDAGRMEEARNEYNRSVQADPTAEAYDQLGDIYARWGDQRQAEAAFRSVIALNAFDSHAHFGLGKVLEAAGKPGDALYEIERGLETDPSDREAKEELVRLRGNAPPLPQPIHP
jgi:Flp pilus assembly protein TadD